MNRNWSWLLAVVALIVGWQGWGWQGVVLAVTLIAFWLILQFNRAMRVMRTAAQSPVGHVDSAVMLNAKLKQGQSLADVIVLTRSLGRKLADEPETYEWTDPGGARVRVVIREGRCDSWTLERPPQ